MTLFRKDEHGEISIRGQIADNTDKKSRSCTTKEVQMGYVRREYREDTEKRGEIADNTERKAEAFRFEG